MLLNNITRRVRNVPNYLRAKVKGKPFHWTMTQKELEMKKKRFESNYIKARNKTRKNQSRRNFICKEVERLGATNAPKYRNIYKKYCLTKENVNVSEVNLDALVKQLRVGNKNNIPNNLNLPLLLPPQKTEEELVAEKAEKEINVSKAVPYRSRANRVAEMLKKNEPLSNEDIQILLKPNKNENTRLKQGGKSKRH